MLGRSVGPLIVVVVVLHAVVGCELNAASRPVFGESCERSGDCASGYVCFRADADDDEGICVNEASVGGAEEGEGEAGEGEGEGEGELPQDCDPPCDNNEVCVIDTCRVICDESTPCDGALVCCSGGCTSLSACDACQTPDGTCTAGESCVPSDFDSFDGACVNQAASSAQIDDLQACEGFSDLGGGNVCLPGSTCAPYVNGDEVCQSICADDSDCAAGHDCDQDSDGAVGLCAPDCEVLASTCDEPLPHCQVDFDDCTGHCTIAGDLANGEACSSQNRCVPGFECIDGFCRAYCEVGINTCDSGFACRANCANGTVGICDRTCTPMTSAECTAPGFPNCIVFDGCNAFCTPTGSVPLGGACESVADCQLGATCFGTSPNFFCREKCDPQAPVCANGGTCSPDTGCAGEGACLP